MRLEPASFEVEHFKLDGNACLEVRGRWFGVRGRRFMRPALTTVTDGREQRILAVLDHKPWNAEDGEIWHAAFPYSTDPAALAQAELTVAPDVTVPLPPPAGPRGGRPARSGGSRGTRKATAAAKARGKRTVGDTTDGHRTENKSRAKQNASDGSTEQAPLELEKLERELAHAHEERDRAIAARAAAIDERQEAIEREVGERIADLRVEFERERAGARLAAQAAHERDEARAAREEVARERDEAARERDEALAERDNARQERNRILAQRDAARTRVEEATRQWELTAALGTRRTLERDALAVERDRAAHDLERARAQLAAVAGERDVALESCDRFADERDAIVQACEQATRERDTALQARDEAARELDAALQARDRTTRELAARQARERDRDQQADVPDGRGAAAKTETRGTEDEEGTIELPAPAAEPEAVPEPAPVRELESTPAPAPLKLAAPPARRRVPRPAPASRQSEPRARPPGRGAGAAIPGARPDAGARSDWPQDPADVWRARLLAISALLIAFVVLLVLLLAK